LRSCGRYGRTPFLVPAYGGGSEIAQGFSRLCAVHGGTYMLDQQVLSVKELVGEEFPVSIQLKDGETLKARRAILNLDYADQGLLEDLGMTVNE
jgi:RAB protein geranylgeranyltransferase component A